MDFGRALLRERRRQADRQGECREDQVDWPAHHSPKNGGIESRPSPAGYRHFGKAIAARKTSNIFMIFNEFLPLGARLLC